MDYFENLNDPLKYYFKEKIGNLYINKNVMDLFIHKGTKGKGKKEQRLSDSFLKFSEIAELKQSKKKNLSQRFLESIGVGKKNLQNSNELFEKRKKKKQIDAMLRNKVNIQLEREEVGMDTRFARFRRNDQQVKETLDLQTSNLNEKLFSRRQRSIIKSRLIRSTF